LQDIAGIDAALLDSVMARLAAGRKAITTPHDQLKLL
jgi:hypothetical protein